MLIPDVFVASRRSVRPGAYDPERVIDLARALVRETGYDLSRALREGVSPGFLGVVAEENLEELVEVLASWAKEAGELGCDRCEEYFTLTAARVEGGVAYCPKCGSVLRSAACALCGRGLYSYGGAGGDEWCGRHVRGFCFCPECAPVARRELGEDDVERRLPSDEVREGGSPRG